MCQGCATEFQTDDFFLQNQKNSKIQKKLKKKKKIPKKVITKKIVENFGFFEFFKVFFK